MSNDYKDFMIEDCVDLLMPEFITTSAECHKNIQKAYETRRFLDKYIYNCCKKLAQIEKKQLVKQISRPYDVVVEEYHVININEQLTEDNCFGDCIVDHGYVNYSDNEEILEDYSNG